MQRNAWRGAVIFLARHRSALPSEAWRILGDAGLLLRDGNGDPVVHDYFVDDPTPYGPLRDTMM